MGRKKKAKIQQDGESQGAVEQYVADQIAAGEPLAEVVMGAATIACEEAAETVHELAAAGSLPVSVPPWVVPPRRDFALLKADAHWWSLNDYAAVVDAMRKTGAKRVLEMGPGSSTLALIEGGAESVDTCEDNPDWAEVYEERLARRFPTAEFPTVVRLHRYVWPEGKGLSIPALKKQRFDLTLIDGPHGTERRPDVVRYALARSTWVLVPTEEHKTRAWMRPIIQAIADEAGRPVQFAETGPLSGAFALVGPA